MEISAAQKQVRTAFMGGFVGQTVSAALWATSASLGGAGRAREAITVLILGGFLIFPLTTMGLRLLGRPPLPRSNPLTWLGMQVAFTLPLSLPVVAAAAAYRLEWFYPAFMIVLGAHYLPFTFLYGMRLFIALCAVLVGGGFAIGWYGIGSFATGAWLTTVVLLVFGVAGGLQVRREEGAVAAA